MIEGMFVFLMGIFSGVMLSIFYIKNKVMIDQLAKEDELFDASKYLTPNKKYFTNRSLEDEGDK